MASDFQGTEVFGHTPRKRRPPIQPVEEPRRRPGTLLGVVAVVAAVATIILVIVGITSAMRGDYGAGTGLAYVATGSSIVAVLGGIAAILLDRGRGWGAVAIILGLAANPLLLTQLLRWASGLG